MTSSIIGVVSAVVWGYISDRTGKPRLLIAAGAIGALVIAQFIPFVHGFWAFFGLSCLGGVMTSPMNTLLDGTTLVMLGTKTENYGRYRIGGSVGYVLAASTAGVLYDVTGLHVLFPIYAAIMGLLALAALFLPNLPVKIKPRQKTEVGVMMRQPVWLVFAISVFLIWMANAAAMNYLGIALLSLGASQSLIGFASVSGSLVEIPCIGFGSWFIKRFGLAKLLLAAIVLMILRYFLLGLMPSPGWAVAINIINGPAYGFFAISAVAYAQKLAPPSLATTSQGILNAIMSLSMVVSSLLTGILFDRIGASGIFLCMSLCCVLAFILFSVGAIRNRPDPAASE
jgi:PPP family 3-phenylpropionic acid transporter